MVEKIYRYTDKPMTWTRALVVGFVIWIIAVVLLGQLPSWIIYEFDQEIAAVIELSKRLPGVDKAGLNTAQVKIVRDIVANTAQMGFLVAMLFIAYQWQRAKRKRGGGSAVTDVVKGYMPGK